MNILYPIQDYLSIATKLPKTRLANFPEATLILKDESQARNKVRKKTLKSFNVELVSIIGGSSNKYSISIVRELPNSCVATNSVDKIKAYSNSTVNYSNLTVNESRAKCIDNWSNKLGEVHYHAHHNILIFNSGGKLLTHLKGKVNFLPSELLNKYLKSALV